MTKLTICRLKKYFTVITVLTIQTNLLVKRTVLVCGNSSYFKKFHRNSLMLSTTLCSSKITGPYWLRYNM